MLQKVMAVSIVALLLSGCDAKRDANIEMKRKQVAAKIGIGDDIFAAKKVLEAEGFSIKYGPDFPAKTKKYLMMIVDYGAHPNGLETFRYTVGIEGDGKPITGVIKATPEGRITSIE
jgi:hypothetical protein